MTPRSEKNVTMFEAESKIGYNLVEPGELVINTMWAWMGALGVSDFEGIVSLPTIFTSLSIEENFAPNTSTCSIGPIVTLDL